jgi:hypothetical protein
MTAPHCINLIEVAGNPDGIPWEAHNRLGRVGAGIHALYDDASTGQRVALIRCMPGATAQAHVHHGHETFLILDGAYHDDSGTYGKGDLVVYRPGSRHAWSTPDGALICAIWGGPVSSSQEAAAASAQASDAHESMQATRRD